MQSLSLVILGPPGAGKGTITARFAHERCVLQISTGAILRDEVIAQTDAGLSAKARMDAGLLVDDDVVLAIVRDRLSNLKSKHGFILDGFPRTVTQAHAFDQWMLNAERRPLTIVAIDVPEVELVRRLRMRLICKACGRNSGAPSNDAGWCVHCGSELIRRTDDRDDNVVMERLRAHQKECRPVVEYYKRCVGFRMINGSQAPEYVAQSLAAAVDEVAVAHQEGVVAGGGAEQDGHRHSEG